MRKTVVVGVLEKALRILDTVQTYPSGLSLDEVNKLTGINKSTAYRLLSHLEREAYLLRDGGGKYLIGTKIMQLASRVNPQGLLRETARPVLRNLLAATKETVNLAVLEAGTVLYVEVLESPYEFRLVSSAGLRRPLYSTALGKALAAFSPAEEIEPVLRSLDFKSVTPHTISTLTQFRQELERVRREYLALDNEEAVLGARCLAAPVLNSRQHAIAAVSLAGPVTRITKDKIGLFGAAVREAAETIAARMGFAKHGTSPAIEPSRTGHLESSELTANRTSESHS